MEGSTRAAPPRRPLVSEVRAQMLRQALSDGSAARAVEGVVLRSLRADEDEATYALQLEVDGAPLELRLEPPELAPDLHRGVWFDLRYPQGSPPPAVATRVEAFLAGVRCFDVGHLAAAADGGRVLLVEFVNADQFPGRINYLYPVVCGYFGARGSETRWIRFAVSTTNLMEHQRDELTLSGEELQRLLGLAREHRPALVILTDALHQPQLREVSEASGGADTFTLGGPESEPLSWLVRNLDLSPRYHWIPGNAAAEQRRIDNVYLLFADGCGHPRRVADNPRYQSCQPEVRGERPGCAFCLVSRPLRNRVMDPWLPATSTRRWVRRQVDTLLRDSAELGRQPNGILLEQWCGQAILAEVVSSLREHGMDDSVQLLFAIRTDLVPRFAEHVRRHLDEDAPARLRFGIHACGVESFSDADLQLYNKATTALDGLTAINIVRELSLSHRGRFWYGGLSFLLFTPWTSLAGLHLNYGLIRFLGMTRKEAGNMYQSRLRLHERLPIRRLVEAEGLLDDDVRDSLVVMNRRKLFGEEEPWRCADPRVEPLMSIVLRFDLLDSPHADSLAQRVAQALRSVAPDWHHGDDRSLQLLLLAMVEVALGQPEPLAEEMLLEQGRRRWEAQRSAAVASRLPFRLGIERLGAGAYIERVAALVRNGLREAFVVELQRGEEVDDPILRRLAANGVAADLVETAQGRCLIVATTRASVDRVAALRERLAGSAPEARVADELGEVLGIPPCCRRGLAEDTRGSFAWAAYARHLELEAPDGAVPLPMWIPRVSFLPCRADCSAATATYRRWFDALGVAPPQAEGHAYVWSLEDAHDGELACLRLAETEDDRVRYRPDDVRGSDDALVGRLRKGDGARLLPGQVRILCGDEVVDCLTATHGWSQAGPAHHPRFWRELARAARFLASAGPTDGMYFPPFGDEGRELAEDAASSTVPESTEAEQPPPRERTDEPRPGAAARRVERGLRFLLDPARGVFRGMKLRELRPAEGEGCVAVRLEVDGTDYLLYLDYRDPGARCLFRTKRFAVSHAADTPLSSADHLRRIYALVRGLDRVFGPGT